MEQDDDYYSQRSQAIDLWPKSIGRIWRFIFAVRRERHHLQ
jgi:hypothetical protein